MGLGRAADSVAAAAAATANVATVLGSNFICFFSNFARLFSTVSAFLCSAAACFLSFFSFRSAAAETVRGREIGTANTSGSGFTTASSLATNARRSARWAERSTTGTGTIMGSEGEEIVSICEEDNSNKALAVMDDEEDEEHDDGEDVEIGSDARGLHSAADRKRGIGGGRSVGTGMFARAAMRASIALRIAQRGRFFASQCNSWPVVLGNRWFNIRRLTARHQWFKS